MADESAPSSEPANPTLRWEDFQALGDLSPEQRDQLLRVVQQVTTSFEGPLLPPQMLAEYDRLIPQGADRLMRLLETKTSHRTRQEERIVKAQTALPLRGQLIGMALCLFFGVIGWHLAINGHDGVAGLLFSTTILGLITVFVLGRTPRREGQSTTAENKGKRLK